MTSATATFTGQLTNQMRLIYPINQFVSIQSALSQWEVAVAVVEVKSEVYMRNYSNVIFMHVMFLDSIYIV